MREDLKNQSLTFTEIAKLVGENWQALTPAERDVYDSQAVRLKARYNHDLNNYRKTADYRRYSHYLVEFKQKQANLSQGSSFLYEGPAAAPPPLPEGTVTDHNRFSQGCVQETKIGSLPALPWERQQ